MNSAIDWKLGVWWSLATIGGLVLGLVILFAGLGAAINHAPPFLFGLVLGCTFGLGCAVMQWLALRRLVSAWWIAGTFAAWAIFKDFYFQFPSKKASDASIFSKDTCYSRVNHRTNVLSKYHPSIMITTSNRYKIHVMSLHVF